MSNPDFSNNSPNMLLPIPAIGLTPGPAYASDVNASLSRIDAHDHTSGYGVPITPSGMLINSQLALNNQLLTSVQAINFISQAANAASFSLFFKGNDLYITNGGGTTFAITNGGSVNAGAGSISGLPSGTASVAFASGVYTFQSATATPGNIDAGSYVFRNNVASGFGVTLSPPLVLPADYSLVLPNKPLTTLPMSLTASGAMGTMSFDTIGTSMGSTGANAIITTAGSTTLINTLGTNPNFLGKAVQESGKNVIVSNTNATTSLAIVRGLVTVSGGIITGTQGEGYSVVRNSSGQYTITFTSAFADTPVVTANCYTLSTSITAVINSASTTTSQIFTLNASTVVTDSSFTFIAIGQRA